MMKNEKQLSRIGWWRMGLRLGLVSVLSITLALGSLLATPSPVQAAECRVSNPCVGCTHTSIQAAISDPSCDTIKVAAKVTHYYENLTVNRAVSLLGGFSTSDWTTRGPASSTTINGSGSSNSVIQLYANATIDNFTITGGSGYSNGSYTVGGGIFIATSAPTISNNIIQGNSANWGGGILISNAVGQPQILNNIIRNNTAIRTTNWGWGGGISVSDASAYIKDNEIRDNTAYWGGGFLLWHTASTIEDNVITGNSAVGSTTDSVGGAFFIERAVPVIRNNFIANNIAWRRADGIYIKLFDETHPGSQAQIVNNTIMANKYSDSSRHAGISIKGEKPPGEACHGISPIIRNNIFALNGCGIQAFGDCAVSPFLSNNDVWGNTVANYDSVSPGPGDISADPLLVNWSGGDYHLQAGSPCINAGTSTNAPPTDFEGDPRPLDGGYDIGADEYATWFDKRANITAPEPGDVITYTITYRNNGAPATGVVITDLLSTDLVNPSFTDSGTNSINRRGGTTYVWDVVGSLGSGSGGIITITARVDPNVVTPTVIWNTAEFYVPGSGSFSDAALIIVGGLETYLPLILKGY